MSGYEVFRACLKIRKPCDEGFWVRPRRRDRSIPAAGCDGPACLFELHFNYAGGEISGPGIASSNKHDFSMALWSLHLMARGDGDCISARHGRKFLGLRCMFSCVIVDDQARSSLTRQECPHPLDENADSEIGRGQKL